MQEINWGNFKARYNGKERETFQWLCYLLFCQEYNQSLGVTRYANHAGIETDPIKVGGEWIGWQAKFFDTALSGHTKEFKDAINTSKKNHPDLTKIIFYTNQDFGQTKKGGVPKSKTAIEEHASSKGVAIEWKTKVFFESPFVAKENADIAKHFFSLEKSIIDLMDQLDAHSSSILKKIKSDIPFGDKTLKIDRAKEILEVRETLKNTTPIILAGEGGVGKTAVVKDFYQLEQAQVPIYLFKAIEFGDITNVNELFVNYGSFSISDFATAYSDVDIKCIVIDSAEKLSDVENKEVFQEFLSALLEHGWRIIFTTRLSYLDDLEYLLVNMYGLAFKTTNISKVSAEQLESFSNEYDFLLPTNARMKNLLENPFYLSEYLQGYKNFTTDITYSDFKSILWGRQIANSSYTKDGTHIKREDCFIALAKQRAEKSTFYLKPDGLDTAILQKLVSDEIIGYDKRTRSYFIAHDIYEEWALEKIIDAKFNEQSEISDFYNSLGSSLPIRRAFRHWLTDKLLIDKKAVKSLIETSITDENIVQHWRDEVLVAVLLSDHAKAFLEQFDDLLLNDNAELLVKITFLLRIACKQVDESYLLLLGINKTNELALQTVFTKPKGSGWQYIISFIANNKDKLEIKGLYSILPILEDWTNKNKSGVTTRDASLIALYYYETVSKQGGFGYRSEELEKRIIKVILNGSSEIKDELSAITDKVIARATIGHREIYSSLVDTMLSSIIDSFVVASAIPDKVIGLAKVAWVLKPQADDDPFGGSGRMMGVEQDFGLTDSRQDFFPSSSLQTPTLALLRAAPDKALDFIVTFTNEAVEKYANSQHANEVQEVEVHLDKETVIKQSISHRLWDMYRGTHVSTSLLESIHMALEKWLLEISATESPESLEAVCMYLLKNSRSASITAVVCSLVLAQPEKLFNVAQILFQTKEFFAYDTSRYLSDQQHKGSLESLKGLGRNYETEIFEDERIKACDDNHRKTSLENQALVYQVFMAKGDDEKEAERRQKIIWAIFDEYYKKLPPASTESDDDRTWRLYLARMDRRKMKLEAEQKDGKTLISFKPEIDTELKQYSEAALQKSNDAMKNMHLKLWSHFRWERATEKYSDYQKYEDDPLLALKETREIVKNLGNGASQDSRLFDGDIPAYVCAVLVRDFWDKLTDDDKLFCEEILINYAILPLQESYGYQYGDGAGVAIGVLPLLFTSSSNKEAIKGILLLLLFDTHPIGMSQTMSDYAVMAILHNLWEKHFDDAQSILFGYLTIGSHYDQIWDEVRENNIKKKIYQTTRRQVLDVLESRYEKEIDAALASKTSYKDIGDISTTDLGVLKTAFELIPPTTTNDDHKKFIASIIPLFLQKLADQEDRHNYTLGNRFFEKLAYFVLNCKKEDIEPYLKPFIDDLKSSRYTEELFSSFVSVEDRIHQYEQFWTVWQLFYPGIVKLCKELSWQHDTKNILHTYLLAWRYWKKDTKQWESLKDRERAFYKKVCKDMGYHTAVLYSITKLLNEIGSGFIDDGIVWLSEMLEKNANLRSDDLEVNTIYYLENIMRKFALNQRQKIKTSPALKKRVLIILDFLIEKGSTTGYLIREDIL